MGEQATVLARWSAILRTVLFLAVMQEKELSLGATESVAWSDGSEMGPPQTARARNALSSELTRLGVL